MRALLNRASTRLWMYRYQLEDSRAAHGQNGRYFRSALCCVVLAFLGLWGGR